VALTSNVPITGRGIGAWFNRIDKPLPPGSKPAGVPYRVVTPDYFNTVGITLRQGRLLTSDDRTESPGIVVNEALVKEYYPNEDPIGKQVYMGAPDNRIFQSAPIVGVVANTRDGGLGADPMPTVYIPLGLVPQWSFFSYVIKTSGDPTSVIKTARQIIRELDPNVAVRDVRTLEDVVSAAVAPARWSTLLLGIFAGVAVVMAVLGMFGVLSYLVTQRTRELGIRIALGASASAVQRMIVARGLWLVGFGLAIGLAGSYALTRFLDTLLYGISATDPLTFFGVAVILAAAAAVASYLPARRATRVDPIIALRTE
jgi:predicted permease